MYNDGLQRQFLENLGDKVPVVVYLANGIKLQGTIISWDNFCICLKRGVQEQLIYKHAIATMQAADPSHAKA